MKGFYSNGKLLITGEYVVLDGALSLAVPSVFGQSLDIEKGDKNLLTWTSFDEQDTVWFEAKFKLENNQILDLINTNDKTVAKRLLQILRTAQQLNPEFLNDAPGYTISTELGFPKNWGLGTSSTLINNIANWAHIDPYQLLETTFGGSGYDIACASANQSLTYQLLQNGQRNIHTVDFDPPFKTHLYFVHLNQKQNSREGIAQYKTNTSDTSLAISRINTITQEMINCETLNEFQNLINEHELLISEIIKQTPVKQHLFKDFNGSIKSLGAWGGDFILVASEANPTSYFKSKGFHTILPYSEMVRN
ncbi:GYDIA family GHMP kinase [uncultured Psychroserpens sp.]|uniref:GYDIA family GHMP kinase n=1 Tax=uncultured Psychroserpens sp. TaxID=255436 RepID=UPI0026399894|nr:GYDIA family GHMP kinase [uncultured Psychroserpens sp.]